MFTESRQALRRLGLPAGDLFDLPTSEQRFPDGAAFRLEVPTINSVDTLKTLLATAEEAGVTINRVDETLGIFRHTTKELQEYIAIARDRGLEMNLSIGPRATYDTGATVLSPQGSRIGYRLRGMEQLVHALEDVRRAVDLGCRGILVYDEGLLSVLGQLRERGELPADLRFKVSAHCGAANAASLQLLERLGGDSINPVRDLSLSMIAALRAAVKVPLDMHTDNPPGSGGFIRSYEAPEIVRIASPVHLKAGNSALREHGQRTTAQDGREMTKQVIVIAEMMQRYFPQAVQSKAGALGLAVPV